MLQPIVLKHQLPELTQGWRLLQDVPINVPGCTLGVANDEPDGAPCE